ncbi:MAG: glycosyltransferase family 4 protein [Planctomycetota bacterium]
MRVLTRPNVGGPTVQAAALWHAHRELGVRTLLVVGRCHDEVALDLAALGVPRVAADAVDRAAAGFVELPDLQNRWSVRGVGGSVGRLRALMAAFAPAVVHTHTTRAGLVGRRAAWAQRVPVVAHTFHGHVLRDHFGPLRSWLLGRLERALARRTQLLFAVSATCRDELAALGVAPAARVRVVPPAVPLPEFATRADARRRLGVADAAWLCACMGRLVPVKRIDRFVDAVAALDGACGHVHGDGPLRGELAARIAARRAPVELLAPDPTARSMLQAYDALVVPSAREGCPLVAVEAFAAGVPVVGFDVPGVRDVLAGGRRGLLVPEAQGAAGLARALVRLRDEPELARQLVAAGRAAPPHHHPAAVAAVLHREYREALARIGYAP